MADFILEIAHKKPQDGFLLAGDIISSGTWLPYLCGLKDTCCVQIFGGAFIFFRWNKWRKHSCIGYVCFSLQCNIEMKVNPRNGDTWDSAYQRHCVRLCNTSGLNKYFFPLGIKLIIPKLNIMIVQWNLLWERYNLRTEQFPFDMSFGFGTIISRSFSFAFSQGYCSKFKGLSSDLCDLNAFTVKDTML